MSAAFTVNPDFEIIRKYYFKDADDDAFYDLIADFKNTGCQFISDAVHDEEQKSEFERLFFEILTKYKVIDHYDNLLYICLYLYQKNWDVHNLWHPNYDSEVRAVQLAQLVLFFQKVEDEKTIDIIFKNGSLKAKVDNKMLTGWIKQFILDSVNAGNIPLTFGETFISAFMDLTPEKLKAVSKLKPKSPRAAYNDALARFCISLYKYINNETILKASDGSMLSNDQSRFFFEIGKLFQMLNKEVVIDKDYMRTLIMAYVRKHQ